MKVTTKLWGQIDADYARSDATGEEWLELTMPRPTGIRNRMVTRLVPRDLVDPKQYEEMLDRAHQEGQTVKVKP